MSHKPKVTKKYLARAQLDPESAVLLEKTSAFALCEWKCRDGGVDFAVQRLVLNGQCYYSIRHLSDRYSTINTIIVLKYTDGEEIYISKAFEVVNRFGIFWNSKLPEPETIKDDPLDLWRFDDTVIEVMFDLPLTKMLAIDAGSKYMQMFHDKTLADCIFKIGNEEIKAHRCILAHNSEVFRAMFSQESTNEAKNGVIQIEDSDCASVNAMLQYMYSGSVELNSENVEGLIFLADKYDVKSLREACIDYLIDNIDGTNIIRTTIIGDLHSSSNILQKCGEYLKKNRTAIFDSDEWKDLKNTNHKLAMQLLELSY